MPIKLPETLVSFFNLHKKTALAFSGGVDSSFLLYAALACGCEVQPYFVDSAFQPRFEYEDARRVAKELGVPFRVVAIDLFAEEAVMKNPPNRCYYCKKALFSTLLAEAKQDGYPVLLDGTNASDDSGDRPGMKALAELGVLSPLRECKITKAEIRSLSKAAGLFTHQKPAYACLATRIPTGTPIQAQALKSVEYCEGILYAMGFSDLRVRVMDKTAKLELPTTQQPLALAKSTEILAAFNGHFDEVVLNLKGRS